MQPESVLKIDLGFQLRSFHLATSSWAQDAGVMQNAVCSFFTSPASPQEKTAFVVFIGLLANTWTSVLNNPCFIFLPIGFSFSSSETPHCPGNSGGDVKAASLSPSSWETVDFSHFLNFLQWKLRKKILTEVNPPVLTWMPDSFLLFHEECLHPGLCRKGLGTRVYVGAAHYGIFYTNTKAKWCMVCETELKSGHDSSSQRFGLNRNRAALTRAKFIWGKIIVAQ